MVVLQVSSPPITILTEEQRKINKDEKERRVGNLRDEVLYCLIIKLLDCLICRLGFTDEKGTILGVYIILDNMPARCRGKALSMLVKIISLKCCV